MSIGIMAWGPPPQPNGLAAPPAGALLGAAGAAWASTRSACIIRLILTEKCRGSTTQPPTGQLELASSAAQPPRSGSARSARFAGRFTLEAGGGPLGEAALEDGAPGISNEVEVIRQVV